MWQKIADVLQKIISKDLIEKLLISYLSYNKGRIDVLLKGTQIHIENRKKRDEIHDRIDSDDIYFLKLLDGYNKSKK